MSKHRIPTLLALLLLIFCCTRLLVRALPGDPLDTLLAETGTRIPRAVIANDLHLSDSPARALATDLQNALHGDWGHSILSGEPVLPLVFARTRKTLLLGLLAALLAFGTSLFLGLGALQSRALNRLCTLHGTLALALPAPWLGPALLYFFCITVPLFPTGGNIILPACALAYGASGVWARLIRERVRETLKSGHATAARARGVSERKIILKYGLAPASPALLAYLGTQLGFLLGGAFIVEVIFGWPGVGALMIDSVLRRDYPLVEASVFMAAAISLTGTFLGDWLQEKVDPRERVL